MRKQSWLKNGCNAFDITHPQSRPLSFWTEQDILEYIQKFNLTIPSVYGDIIDLVMFGCLDRFPEIDDGKQTTRTLKE